MADITDARSVLIAAVSFEQTRQVTNTGDDDIEVSTDPHFVSGYGIRIAPGDSAPVVLHIREALYALCAAGGSSTASVDDKPLVDAPPGKFKYDTDTDTVTLAAAALSLDELVIGEAVFGHVPNDLAGDVTSLKAGRLLLSSSSLGVLVDSQNIEFTSSGSLAFRGQNRDSDIQTYLLQRAAGTVEVMKAGGGASFVHVYSPDGSRHSVGVNNSGQLVVAAA